jgi:beta-aspartyl-peptidase (threonine type)
MLEDGESALSAAVSAVRYLENDPRFNAGSGSELRIDGRTIQLDAACMTSDGEFGAVACLEGVRNPIDLACGVLLESPHILMTGEGARIFARDQGIPLLPLPDVPNASVPRDAPSCDTVGAVVFDGMDFASALSSGGISTAALGRVGDVPLPGCGLFCGPAGAIACTGYGEQIALKILAREVYEWLKDGLGAPDAGRKARRLFDATVQIGIIILTPTSCAANASDGMAWARMTQYE